MRRSLLNKCDFFKSVTSFKGGHGYYSPWTLKNLATPLIMPVMLSHVLKERH